MSLKYNYDTSYDPPALTVEVEVFHPTNGASILRKGKIDTAADATVIPTEIRSKLNLAPAGEVTLRDYKGDWEKTATYFVDISLGGIKIELVEVTSTDRDTVLIGRDILNGWKIFADGKAQVFSLEDP